MNARRWTAAIMSTAIGSPSTSVVAGKGVASQRTTDRTIDEGESEVNASTSLMTWASSPVVTNVKPSGPIEIPSP